MAQMTENDIRRIAREESLKVVQDISDKLTKQSEILSRIDRLLLGEIGTDESDTLKARATFAWAYAKRNTESGIIEDAKPALAWYKDWSTTDKGCTESKLDTLGKIVTAWSSGKWLLGLFGVVNISTLIGLAILVFNFIKLVKDIG